MIICAIMFNMYSGIKRCPKACAMDNGVKYLWFFQSSSVIIHLSHVFVVLIKAVFKEVCNFSPYMLCNFHT